MSLAVLCPGETTAEVFQSMLRHQHLSTGSGVSTLAMEEQRFVQTVSEIKSIFPKLCCRLSCHHLLIQFLGYDRSLFDLLLKSIHFA